MASVSFYTRSSKDDKNVPIYARFRDTDFNIRVKSGFFVSPRYWSNKTGTLKKTRLYTDDFPEKDQTKLINDLSSLRQVVFTAYGELIREKIRPTSEWLNSIIDVYHGKDKPKLPDMNLNEYIEKFISDIQAGERLVTSKPHEGERYKPLTIKNYKGFQLQFIAFQKATRRKMNFNDVNVDLYNDFIQFFSKKGYSPNTIGRHIKTLKSIVRAAYEDGLHTNTEVNRKAFKTIRVPVDNIYLTERELKAMLDLDLSDKSVLEIARDIFLIGCYTAQRFSDYSAIKESHIRRLRNGSVIDLVQKKTGERVIIPVRPELETLLQKYGYCVPKIWEQKLNQHIKTVGEMAGIIEPVNINQTRGGMVVQKTVPKNELIKTHTARRSGCTNMYLAGISTLDIMKISGHKTEREFLGYIKVGKEETAATLSLHPYFTGNQLKIV
jgi:site-specific recombinase XerD